jgi:hypothetical protein
VLQNHLFTFKEKHPESTHHSGRKIWNFGHQGK